MVGEAGLTVGVLRRMLASLRTVILYREAEDVPVLGDDGSAVFYILERSVFEISDDDALPLVLLHPDNLALLEDQCAQRGVELVRFGAL